LKTQARFIPMALPLCPPVLPTLAGAQFSPTGNFQLQTRVQHQHRLRPWLASTNLTAWTKHRLGLHRHERHAALPGHQRRQFPQPLLTAPNWPLPIIPVAASSAESRHLKMGKEICGRSAETPLRVSKAGREFFFLSPKKNCFHVAHGESGKMKNARGENRVGFAFEQHVGHVLQVVPAPAAWLPPATPQRIRSRAPRDDQNQIPLFVPSASMEFQKQFRPRPS